ncbi:hypothetical protein BHM03_00020440 [Ensete ventricosum]|nr:hypothetical protein BHM03_00020440 [Ensete ventricosum]
MVGMRPLERSLEKLDDVRKKKLSDLIGSSGGGETSTSGEGANLTTTKKSVSVKTNVKKADGAGQSKALGSVETEDVEGGLMLTGISERVADIKTRSQAMKCLTTFSEAVGPGFIFDRVTVSMTYKLYKIMKDHKNPKVLSEGISWMVSAVEDFGVSHIKLKISRVL